MDLEAKRQRHPELEQEETVSQNRTTFQRIGSLLKGTLKVISDISSGRRVPIELQDLITQDQMDYVVQQYEADTKQESKLQEPLSAEEIWRGPGGSQHDKEKRFYATVEMHCDIRVSDLTDDQCNALRVYCLKVTGHPGASML